MRDSLIIFTLLFQWQNNAQTIRPAQANEDLEFLRKSIIENNPALPKYHSEFNSLSIQLIENTKNEAVSILEHFSIISKICALANEGHFKLVPNHPVGNATWDLPVPTTFELEDPESFKRE